jgi:hypothetical protein
LGNENDKSLVDPISKVSKGFFILNTQKTIKFGVGQSVNDVLFAMAKFFFENWAISDEKSTAQVGTRHKILRLVNLGRKQETTYN